MKVGLVSDVHCNVAALEIAFELLSDCDEVLCAGDLMYQYRFEGEILKALQRRGAHTILGNHDKTILYAPNHPLRNAAKVPQKMLELLGSLPSNLAMEFGGVRIRMFHGAPWDEVAGPSAHYLYPEDKAAMARLAAVDADIIVLGHTHQPYATELAGRLVVNPGSCGEPKLGTTLRFCAAVDLGDRSVDFRSFPAESL